MNSVGVLYNFFQKLRPNRYNVCQRFKPHNVKQVIFMFIYYQILRGVLGYWVQLMFVSETSIKYFTLFDKE